MRDSKVTEFKSQVELPTKIFSSFSSLSPHPHSHIHHHHSLPHPPHPHSHYHLDQIGAGCKLKMDDSGNILVKRVNTNRSIIGKREKLMDDDDDQHDDGQQNYYLEDDVDL